MLDRAHRLTHPRDFARVTRRGRRKVGTFVVCHTAPGEKESMENGEHRELGRVGPARFGFVASKAVGNAPTRNLVKRRLREIVREVMNEQLGDVVVRVLPAAAGADWNQLRTEVRALLGAREQ